MAKNEHSLEYQRLLVRRAQNDSAAFGELFDMYYPQILGYVARRTADVALAEDITSEVFIKALHGLSRFTWQGVPVSAWLYKIATNELRMYYRQKRHVSSLEELEEVAGFELADEKDFVEEIAEAQTAIERHKTFLRAQAHIARLPLKYQEVLMLRFAEQKKVQEISQIVGKREGTVKSLLSRGLALLRASLEQPAMQPSAQARIIASEGRNNRPQGNYER